MSRRVKCPSCGLPGERTSRVRVVFAEFTLSRGGRTITHAQRDDVMRIYRCPDGHRWTVATAAQGAGNLEPRTRAMKGATE